MSALLTAYCDALRHGLALNDSDIDIMPPPGKPPATAGQVFYAVHPGPWSQRQDLSMDEWLGFQVTVSLRAMGLPYDRWGRELMVRPRTGLYPLAEKARAILHMNYEAMDVTNRLIQDSGVTQNGYVEPPQFKDGELPVIRDGSWWWGDRQEQLAGLSITLTIGEGERIQLIEGQS